MTSTFNANLGSNFGKNASDGLIRQLGIGPVWRLRERDAASPEQVADSVTESVTDSVRELPISVADTLPVAQMSWEQLQTSVSQCTKCRLAETRERTIFGDGDTRPKVIVIVSGADKDAEREGTLLVGRAGALLENMLGSIGISRVEGGFVTGLVKCRASSNGEAGGGERVPALEEIAACRPYLERQIALLRPQVLLALGSNVSAAVLDLQSENLPVVTSQDPLTLLLDPLLKKSVWADLCRTADALRHQV